MPAFGAVVPGPAEGDRADHGVDGLGPVAGKRCPVPGPAVRARAAVAGVGSRASLPVTRRRAWSSRCGSPAPAPPGHHRPPPTVPPRRPAGLSRRPPPRRAAADRGAPFFAPGPSRARVPAAGTGLASQIASLTSTICWLSAVNCLVVRQLGADLRHLGRRQLTGPRLAARRLRPQPARPVAGMPGLRASAIRLAAAAVGRVNAPGPQVPDRGQPRMQLCSLLLQLRQGWLSHGLLLSGRLTTSRLGPQPALSPDPYIRVAHPVA